MWYILSNEVGTVLAVYGSALGKLAEAKAEEISKHGTVFVHFVRLAKRPEIGQSISMTGNPKRYG